jgi:PKD domain/IPT/TIG domain
MSVAVAVTIDGANPLRVNTVVTGATAPIQWGWGDGTTAEADADFASTHTYQRPGIYTAQLRAREGRHPVPIAVGGFALSGPWIERLDPPSAPLGSDDLTLHVIGRNFTADDVIVWNRGDEPTTFVSDTELTTGVQPSTATGPRSVWVQVRDQYGTMSNGATFSFPNFPLPLAVPLVLGVTVNPVGVGSLAADVLIENNSEASVLDYGDGSPTEALGPWEPAGGFSGSTRHTFPSAGTYTVTVTMGATVAQDTVTLPPLARAEGYDPGEHTVVEVKAYVDEHPDEAADILAAEQGGQNRTTLVSYLEGVNG